MKIYFHGAAQTVTGSQHLLEINGHLLLLECGMFQGRRADTYERNSHFPFTPTKIDAVILSHAHIDHSGNLPNLVKQGYKGPIYCTHATAHLSNIMLLDAGHIQEADAEYASKKNLQRGEPPVKPLYTQEDAAEVAMFFQPMYYDQPFEPIPGVKARLVEAGHILGSAQVELEIDDNGMQKRLLFSGDLGRRKLPLLRDPQMPEPNDYLIMESTYGDKLHNDPEEAYNELRQVVGTTIRRGGKVIIPAFAVGRTQELVYDLQRMINDNEIPRIPVYVDSPLAVNTSEVFKKHPECLDEETLRFLQSNGHQKLLGFDLLTFTRSVEESKALNNRKDPMVIISASGMAETGRILHHLKNNIENPLNTVLIVSWQAPNTLGRRLAEGDTQVKIFGEVYERRAQVATIDGLSAHAGQDLLVEYASSIKDSLRKVYLVHGEEGPAAVLTGKLRQAGVKDVAYPALHSLAEV